MVAAFQLARQLNAIPVRALGLHNPRDNRGNGGLLHNPPDVIELLARDNGIAGVTECLLIHLPFIIEGIHDHDHVGSRSAVAGCSHAAYRAPRESEAWRFGRAFLMKSTIKFVD